MAGVQLLRAQTQYYIHEHHYVLKIFPMKEIPAFVTSFPVFTHGHILRITGWQDPVKCLPADTVKFHLINIAPLVL